jgi:molybdate transport system ATP-binding protein
MSDAPWPAPQGLVASLTLRHAPLPIVFDVALPALGVTALFGPSGAGKTSCLRMIAGLDRRPTGRLTFGAETWFDSARRIFVPPHLRRIGYVAQGGGLFEHLDVAGNLDFAFRRAGRPGHLDRDDLIDQFGLRGLLTRRVLALSGGERQRVAIARALLSDPALLLLDEPLSALDDAARADLLELLEALHARRAAPMIYVSHSIDEVARLADHLVLLEAGRVVTQGPLNATITRMDLPPALIEAAGAVIEGLVTGHDDGDHLTELGFDGGLLLLPRNKARVGDRLRCRIGARDVVLTQERQVGVSALNQIRCRVVAIGDADHPSQCLVQLEAGGTVLLARITRRSRRELDLSPGREIWAQVKAVALGA